VLSEIPGYADEHRHDLEALVIQGSDAMHHGVKA
jgi:hypothetical protein